MKLLLVIVLCLLLGLATHGSLGDMDPYYRHCVSDCQSSSCNGYTTQSSNARRHDLFKLVTWDCIDTCKYDCMTAITKHRLESGYSVLKYYGHWPFNRLLGLEEPASVVFSALNFIPHALFLFRIYAARESRQHHYMTEALVCYALCACNAWIASTLFHSKKTHEATQYDYISALIFLCSGLWVSIRRLCGPTASSTLMWAIPSAIASICAHRVMQMINGEISFDNHMKVCIGLVIVTTTVWVLWCLKTVYSKTTASRHHWICLGCQLWLIAASALEIFDFPPYFQLFDAHSLWHAATVPLGFIWYDWFWKQDCKPC